MNDLTTPPTAKISPEVWQQIIEVNQANRALDEQRRLLSDQLFRLIEPYLAQHDLELDEALQKFEDDHYPAFEWESGIGHELRMRIRYLQKKEEGS